MKQGSTIAVYVKEIHEETPQVKSFVLAPLNGKDQLPGFGGGAHIVTYVESNGEIIERPYSLAGSPHERGSYRIAIRLSEASRGGSEYWHKKVKVGDQLEISYPKNRFALSFRARHHVFYAAGIGITPFLSMMAELKARGAGFELHYAARSEEECAFYGWIQKHYGEESRFYFSQGPSARRLRPELLKDHPIGTHVYFCGPSAMIAEFTQAARACGYPEGSIHFERFTAPKAVHPKPFQAKLKRSGITLEIAAGQTLLDSLLQAGIKAPYSCRVGGCGTCALEVLEGEVEHLDSFLDEQERNSNRIILPCVSRARSAKLVLDI